MPNLFDYRMTQHSVDEGTKSIRNLNILTNLIRYRGLKCFTTTPVAEL